MSFFEQEFVLGQNIENTQDEYTPVTPGWYSARIVEAELKDTKAGTGQYIKVRFQLDGSRGVYHNFNIKNANPKAEDIGKQQLGQWMAASNAGRLKGPDDMLGHSCQVKVAIKDDPQYGPQNVIKAFKKGEAGGESPKPQSKDVPPWMAK